MPLMVLVVGGALGLILLAIGLRGRRVNDHPYCRRCRFDLTGLSTSAESDELPRCPECGAELTQAKAIRMGRRQVRRSSLITGCVLLALVSSTVVLPIIVGLFSPNANAYKPTWWLMIEAQPSANPTSDAAMRELVTRLNASNLGTRAVRSLVTRGLAFQADETKPWSTAWGDFIEAGRSKGHVTSEQWKQYARQGVTYTMRAQPKVLLGQPTHVHIELNTRWAQTSALRCWPAIWETNNDFEPTWIAIMISEPSSSGVSLMSYRQYNAFQRSNAGSAEPEVKTQSFTLHLNTIVAEGPSAHSRPRDLVLTTDGDQVPQHVIDACGITQPQPPGSRQSDFPAVWNTRLSFDVDIHKSLGALVQGTTDPAMRPAVHDLCAKAEIIVDTRQPNGPASVRLPNGSLPVAIAFNVYQKLDDGTRIPINSIARSSTGDKLFIGIEELQCDQNAALSPTATIVFEPNPELTIWSPQIKEIWGEEVVIENVPVRVLPSTP